MVFMKELVKETGGFLSYSSITFFFLGLFFCENGEFRTHSLVLREQWF